MHMMRNVFLAVSMVLVAASQSWCDEVKDELKALEGTWIPTSGELGGQKLPDEALKVIKLVLKGDQYTVTVGDRLDKGTCKLMPAAKPKAMDITGTDGPNQGKTYPAIYERKGNTMKLCYNLGGSERPKEFKSPAGTQIFLVTYERK